MSARFNAAILWIAENDDEEAGNPEFPLVTEAMVADLFGATTDHVCFCVARARAYIAEGRKVPIMQAHVGRAKAGAL